MQHAHSNASTSIPCGGVFAGGRERIVARFRTNTIFVMVKYYQDENSPMALSNDEKKAIETRALIAARKAGVPIPSGEIPGERPDFRFNANTLGVEVSELLKPASSNFGIVPAEAESYHNEIVQLAQQQYYARPDRIPVTINLYFANTRGKKRDKREMASRLAEFIKANLPGPGETLNFGNLRLPEGFGSMSIWRESRDWWCGEGGGYTVLNIQEALTSRISEKNSLLPVYRKNLAPGAQVWLLLYSTFSVARGMSIPHGIEDWRFSFDFDRVFWFTSLSKGFVEIQRADAAKTA
jgi:hypothetical protein